jgi:hypothetical protein
LQKEAIMTRLAGFVVLASIIAVTVPAVAQQVPAPATATRKAFQALDLGMTREQVSKVVGSQGPMDLKQETWGRWIPGAKVGDMEVLRVHFFDNRAYWVEYDAFGEAWWREEKGGCYEWVKTPMRRLRESFDLK